MRALQNSYSVPIEELADNIRNHVVIPLLGMARDNDRVRVLRNNSLLEIGEVLKGVEEK